MLRYQSVSEKIGSLPQTYEKQSFRQLPFAVRALIFFGLCSLVISCGGVSAENPEVGARSSPDTRPTHTLTVEPIDVIDATPTQNLILTPAEADGICEVVTLLSEPGWHLEGTGPKEAYQDLDDPLILRGKDRLNVTLDFHGTDFLTEEQSTSRDATALIFDQEDWKTVMLATDDFNGFDGAQTLGVPLSAVVGVGKVEGIPLDPDAPVGTMHTRIWYAAHPYEMDISEITAFDSHDPDCAGEAAKADYVLPGGDISSTISTVTPAVSTPEGTVTSTASGGYHEWEVFGADTMKVTKDEVKNQRTTAELERHVNLAIDAGFNMMTVDVPYESPQGHDSPGYAQRVIDVIRRVAEERGVEMKVGHRRMFAAMEGIYDYEGSPQQRIRGEEMSEHLKEIASAIHTVPIERLDQYLVGMYDYIVTHPEEYRRGDRFYLPPELDVRGIFGVHGCTEEECMFSSADDFNQWNVDAVAIAQEALAEIGLSGLVEVQSGGLTGTTVAWLNNPDHEGTTVLSCETIDAFGGKVVLDHYPPNPEDMERDLDVAISTLRSKCTEEFEELVIGEVGGRTKEEIFILLNAIVANGIDEANYWPFSGGDTGLLTDDGTVSERYDAVIEFNSR